MHNYTVGNRYLTKTKLGNWYQQNELKNYQLREFLHQKSHKGNLTLASQTKIQYSQQPIELSPHTDGRIYYGDWFMLHNHYTNAFLAFNVNESIMGQETYAVTTIKNNRPALRNVFQIQPAQHTQTNILCYGAKVKFVTYAASRKIFLQSLPVSPMRSSRFSRQQEVSVTATANSNSTWVLEHSDPALRFDAVGEAILSTDSVLVKHCLTCQWLASDTVNYVNQFGSEYEVFAKSFISKNKTQNLFSEKQGHRSAENPLRAQSKQNFWTIVKGEARSQGRQKQPDNEAQ